MSSERKTYIVSITADDTARVAVDLTEGERGLVASLAEAIDKAGVTYSGRLSIVARPGGGADSDCPTCLGTGHEPYGYGHPCHCLPRETVERPS